MEMLNCKLPDVYSKYSEKSPKLIWYVSFNPFFTEFTETPFYGHCFRPNVAKCKAYVLLEQLNKIDSSVEMFA